MCRNTLPVLIALIACAIYSAGPVHASSAGDSLRYLLEADAGPRERADALLRTATRRSTSDPVGALGLLGEAERQATIAADSGQVHEVLLAAAALQLRMGRRADHMRTSLRALRIAKHLSRPEWISLDLQNVARAYRLREEPERAITEARNALAIAIKAESPAVRHGAEMLLIEVLIDGGEFQEAQRTADRALSVGDADPMHRAQVQFLLARSLLGQHRPFDAQPLLIAAEQVFVERGEAAHATETALALAQLAIQQGRFKEAGERLNALGERCRTVNQKIGLLEARHALAEAESDFARAHGVLEALVALRDSIRRADRDLLLSGMHALHDMELREQDNAELRIDNARKEAHIADAVRDRMVLIAAASGFAILSAALLWLLWRHRRIIRRSGLKSAVITRQRDQLEAKGLELERQNLRLREALLSDERKDLVIREIHHRVKNNLQAIDALLSLSMGDEADPRTNRLLREARGRLRAMALVHGTIHHNGSESEVPMRGHFEELARLVLVAHGRHDAIAARVDVTDASVEAAVLLPLSLLVNELLTNSLKHSLYSSIQGCITLSIRHEQGEWVLRYADDGHRKPAAESGGRTGSVGMGLMRSLADQLEGSLVMHEVDGVSAELRFGAPVLVHRKAS